MDLIKCPECGEMYSSSYPCCPFCEEDGENSRKIKYTPKRRIADRSKAQSARGGLIVVLVLVLGLLSWYLFGDSIAGRDKTKTPDDKQTLANEPVVPVNSTTNVDPFYTPGSTPGEDSPALPGTEPPDTANGGDGAQADPAPEPPAPEENENVDVSNAALNREDFTLSGVGDSFRVKVSGTEATPHWSIDNANVASLAADGTVTAVANGSTKLRCKVGARELTCVVRVNNTGRTAEPASAPTSVEPVVPTAPASPGTATTAPASSGTATTAPVSSGTATTAPASSSGVHVDASALSVKTNYGTTLQKDPDTHYPDCTVVINGDPIALRISGTDVPVSSWTSDNTSVVTVSADGKLTPVSKGTAHVIATVGDATVTCIIRVRNK